MRRVLSLCFLGIFLLSPQGQLLAGTTGKIAGRVIDKKTGEPLIGANVLILGTHLGAAADNKGKYFILQVPPGTYSVRATMIGYVPVTVKGVKVRVDLTTRVDFELEPTVIESPGVVVTAKRPMILLDVTASSRYTSKEEIANIPDAESFEDVVSLQPGTLILTPQPYIPIEEGRAIQVRDESVRDIHIRGGRGGEVLYQIDGVPITHPIYGGRAVLNMDVIAVKEMEMLTGGFNAEYGQAQSGVVNIVTREGGDRLEGEIQYKTDNLSPSGASFNTDYLAFYIGGPEPFTSYLLPALGIHLPGKVRFFLSGSGDVTDTPYPNRRRREFIYLPMVKVLERQYNELTTNLKLTYWPSSTHKFTLSYRRGGIRWSNFDWAWRNLPDSTISSKRITDFLSLSYTHTLSKATFYTLYLGWLRTSYKSSLYGKTPPEFWHWENGKYVGSSFGQDVDHDGFVDFGQQQNWRDDLSYVLTLKGDLTSQVHPTHLMKCGFEVRYNDIRYVDIQYGGSYLTRYGEYVIKGGEPAPRPPGPFPEYGLFRWVFRAFPTLGSLYIQDKIEKLGLIINAGLRLDWFTPGSTVRKKGYIDQWERATGLKLHLRRFKANLSPRLGISFPISERMVMYFSYGHFSQMPELQYLYRDPWTGTWVGNPDLDPELTIAYEFGFAHQLTRDMTIDIKGYSKDISKTVGQTEVRPPNGPPVWIWENKGYGRARGIELQFKKHYSNFTSGLLSYTYQWALGYSSSAFEEYQRSINDIPLPIRENRLDWDIRHSIILQFTLSVPPGKHPRIFGIRLPEAWNTTLLWKFQSGLPYTPAGTDIVITLNSKTAPYTSAFDLKCEKEFRLGSVKWGLFLNVLNLFNRKNVQKNFGFNAWTGQPYRYGDLALPWPRFYTWREISFLRDPRMFAPSRQIKIGMKLGW